MISYAREDLEIAEKIYFDLKRAGLKPWLDKEDIAIGEDWEEAIYKAINDASHFIALISKNSINKKGFVQTELKKALKILDTFPPYHVYLLPVRIDNCEPTYRKLRGLNWLDIFPNYSKGLEKLLKSISFYFNDEQLETAKNAFVFSENFVKESFANNSMKIDMNNLSFCTTKSLSTDQLAEKTSIYSIILRYPNYEMNERLYNYKICLQDFNILSTLSRDPNKKLLPFLVYIFTHQLILISYFQNKKCSFNSQEDLKEEFTNKAHREAIRVLKKINLLGINDILEHFNPYVNSM